MRNLLFMVLCQSFMYCQNEISKNPWDFPGYGGNKFPIIANGIVREKNDTLQNKSFAAYQEIEKYLSLIETASFSIASINLTPENTYGNYDTYVHDIIKIAKEKKLTILVYDHRVKRGFPFFTANNLIKEYPFPEIYGFFVDEPSLNEMPRLGEWAKPFNRGLTDSSDVFWHKLMYVNLYGYHAIGKNKYEEYLSTWIKTGKPRVLSFDNYSVWDDEQATRYGFGIGGDWTRDYFVNLELFSHLSTQHQIPFWTWILVHQHWSVYSKRFYRRSTLSDLRFQIFSALAYGAKGLLYYNFWNPPESSNSIWNEQYAILDKDGNTTDLFFEAKKVNKVIQSIGTVLLDLESEGVYHSSNGLWSENKKTFLTNWDPLYDPNGNTTDTKYGIKLSSWNTPDKLPAHILKNKIVYAINNPNGMVGQLKNGKTGETFLVVVNKNRYSRQSIDFDILIDENRITYQSALLNVNVNKTYYGIRHASPQRLSFELSLDPGEGVLLKITK